MNKLIQLTITVLALAAASASGAEESLLEDIAAQITLADDTAALKAANPDKQELVPLESARNTRQQIVYTVGNRVSGDRLVASGQDSQSWSTSQDVTLILGYPTSGVGAVVSYVQVVVNQSSNQGRGYVTAGGIGQRYIQLEIDAFNTNYISYSVQIYGY